MSLFLKAPAKINWFLSVTGRRSDGYHDIVSLLQCVTLFDNLYFEESDTIELVSDLAIPAEENLVYKAAMLLKQTSMFRRGARITLEKRIPSAAGLGGGSSDAAFTLMGLNRLWGLDMDISQLGRLGAEIGSDVPFFISGPLSLVSGRGEIINPIESGTSAALLLVKPSADVSAGWAYRSLNIEKLTKKSIDIKLFCHNLERRDFLSLRDMVFNDLEEAVISAHREIADIKDLLLYHGAAITCMSGSGSTVYGVFNSIDEALNASRYTEKYWCRVVNTLGMDDKPEIWPERPDV
jgi:4-diphosphocytidyl-2-C-methyl-D-erythritol kinase